jgi:hypothetical protein
VQEENKETAMILKRLAKHLENIGSVIHRYYSLDYYAPFANAILIRRGAGDGDGTSLIRESKNDYMHAIHALPLHHGRKLSSVQSP